MSRVPSETAIEREMEECGLDRMPAIRRIQQRAAIQRDMREKRT